MLVLEMHIDENGKISTYDFPQLTSGRSVTAIIDDVTSRDIFTDAYKADFSRFWDKVAMDIGNNDIEALRRQFHVLLVYPDKTVCKYKNQIKEVER